MPQSELLTGQNFETLTEDESLFEEQPDDIEQIAEPTDEELQAVVAEAEEIVRQAAGRVAIKKFVREKQYYTDNEEEEDTVGFFLNTIKDFKVLKLQEVSELKTAMDAGREAEQFLTNPGLSQTDTDAYRQQMKAGHAAYEKMFNHNLKLVFACAQRYISPFQPESVDIMDFVQEGMLGLKRAIDGFDPARKFQFSTYANWWIRASMQKLALGRRGNIYIPPARMMEARNALAAADGDFNQLTPTQQEVIALSRTVSFEQLVTDGAITRKLELTLASQEAEVEEEVMQNPEKADTSALIFETLVNQRLVKAGAADKNPRRQKSERIKAEIVARKQTDAVKLRFRLDEEADATEVQQPLRTLKEVAEILGAKEDTVGEWVKNALASLRESGVFINLNSSAQN